MGGESLCGKYLGPRVDCADRRPQGHWSRVGQSASRVPTWNNAANDEYAGRRCAVPHENPGEQVLWRHRKHHIAEWQHYFLGCYNVVRAATAHGGANPAGLQTLVRASAPAALPRVRRGVLQGRLQHWRRACEPLRVRIRRRAQMHHLEWAGAWRCPRCDLAGVRLSKQL